MLLTAAGLGFSYPGSPPLLTGISVEVGLGDSLAITGPSGSGKSTTVSVLLQLVEPTAGTITIGGTDLNTIDKESLWRQVSWVPQRPVIVPGTVLENAGS